MRAQLLRLGFQAITLFRSELLANFSPNPNPNPNPKLSSLSLAVVLEDFAKVH